MIPVYNEENQQHLRILLETKKYSNISYQQKEIFMDKFGKTYTGNSNPLQWRMGRVIIAKL
jgi:hypothetical protein